MEHGGHNHAAGVDRHVEEVRLLHTTQNMDHNLSAEDERRIPSYVSFVDM